MSAVGPYPNVLQRRDNTDAYARIADEAVRTHAGGGLSPEQLASSSSSAAAGGAPLTSEARAASERRRQDALGRQAQLAGLAALTERRRQLAADVQSATAQCPLVQAAPGCRTDIFGAACDGDVEEIKRNLDYYVENYPYAEQERQQARRERLADAQAEEGAQQSEAPALEEREEAEAAEEAQKPLDEAERARRRRVLLGSQGQPNPRHYSGVQFTQRWEFTAPPLVFAAAFRRERAVRALLQWGADPLAVGSTHTRASAYAVARGYDELAELLQAAERREADREAAEQAQAQA